MSVFQSPNPEVGKLRKKVTVMVTSKRMGLDPSLSQISDVAWGVT